MASQKIKRDYSIFIIRGKKQKRNLIELKLLEKLIALYFPLLNYELSLGKLSHSPMN